jgi:hypothetical protein
MGRYIVVILLLWTGAARGQSLDVPDAPLTKTTWTTFVGLGAEILADGVTTRILYQRHHDELDPLAKPFVHAGVPGQIGASLLGAGAMGGAWFLLHRTHHDRAAGWFLRSMTGSEGYNVARQFDLLRKSQANQDQAADRAYLKSQRTSRFRRTISGVETGDKRKF